MPISEERTQELVKILKSFEGMDASDETYQATRKSIAEEVEGINSEDLSTLAEREELPEDVSRELNILVRKLVPKEQRAEELRRINDTPQTSIRNDGTRSSASGDHPKKQVRFAEKLITSDSSNHKSPS